MFLAVLSPRLPLRFGPLITSYYTRFSHFTSSFASFFLFFCLILSLRLPHIASSFTSSFTSSFASYSLICPLRLPNFPLRFILPHRTLPPPLPHGFPIEFASTTVDVSTGKLRPRLQLFKSELHSFYFSSGKFIRSLFN